MTTTETFDAIIIGAGQAGPPLALDLASAGWNCAIIERRYVGGTCVNDGCTPTKTMIASARRAYVSRHAELLGVQVDQVSVNLTKVRQRKDAIVESFRQGSRESLEQADRVELIEGEASFRSPQIISVSLNDNSGQRHLTADTIVINSGARPRRPAIEGLETIDPLDSSSIMKLEELPEHLIVLGGGYVGLEFGQMFRRFGSQVTILQHSGQLLTREDQDIADEVAEILRSEGIKVHLDARTTAVKPSEGGKIELEFNKAGKAATVVGSHLLLAVGRLPNTDTLRTDQAGIELNSRGHIIVDEGLRTTADGIYAMGDVKGGPAFTHISYDDYRVLAANLLEETGRTISDRPVPYVVYLDPQLGRIGLTEAQAEEAGLNYRVARLPMASVARAIEVGETKGLLKAIVDADNDHILGVAFLGMEGGELMSAVQLAMMGDLPYTTLRDGIFAHPTLAEALNNLFSSLN